MAACCPASMSRLPDACRLQLLLDQSASKWSPLNFMVPWDTFATRMLPFPSASTLPVTPTLLLGLLTWPWMSPPATSRTMVLVKLHLSDAGMSASHLPSKDAAEAGVIG